MNGPRADAGRSRFAGVRMILRYNWPLYGAGVTTAVAGWLSVASVVASWWVYDRSELGRWTWLSRVMPNVPTRILVVHADLDDASEPVRRVIRVSGLELVTEERITPFVAVLTAERSS